jgi:hypothetical protein
VDSSRAGINAAIFILLIFLNNSLQDIDNIIENGLTFHVEKSELAAILHHQYLLHAELLRVFVGFHFKPIGFFKQ